MLYLQDLVFFEIITIFPLWGNVVHNLFIYMLVDSPH